METAIKPENRQVLTLISRVGTIGYLLSCLEVGGVRTATSTVHLAQVVMDRIGSDQIYLIHFKCSIFKVEATAGVNKAKGEIYYVKGGADFRRVCDNLDC